MSAYDAYLAMQRGDMAAARQFLLDSPSHGHTP